MQLISWNIYPEKYSHSNDILLDPNTPNTSLPFNHNTKLIKMQMKYIYHYNWKLLKQIRNRSLVYDVHGSYTYFRF